MQTGLADQQLYISEFQTEGVLKWCWRIYGFHSPQYRHW